MEEVQTVTAIQREVSNGIKSITASQFNRWIFKKVQPYLKGRILDSGNSNGSIAGVCMQNNMTVDTPPINQSVCYDTIIALDVDTDITKQSTKPVNFTQLLIPEGTLLLLSPVNIALYSELSKGLEYWHIHNKQLVKQSLKGDFNIIKTRYFSLSDAFTYSSQQASIYDRLVTRFYISDSEAFQKIGIFVITIAKKIKQLI